MVERRRHSRVSIRRLWREFSASLSKVMQCILLHYYTVECMYGEWVYTIHCIMLFHCYLFCPLYAVISFSHLCLVFNRKYSHSIVPHIMWSCDHHVLESIATICDQPLTHILKECLPICMVFIITIFSEETNNGEDSPKKLLATSCYDYLVSTLTSAVVDETMKHSLNEFIVELLLRLHVEHDSDSVLAKHTR